MSSLSWKSLPALVAVVLFTATATVAAETCGDPDASGSVTVTDGVQTLRAAAGLSSSCTNATCDIDGNGTITVTDGVNVLRLAAGLSVTLGCPGGGIDAQVQNLLQSSLPIFGNLTKLGGSSSASARAAETQQCDNSDGFVTIDSSTGQLTFRNCDLSGFKYDGTFLVGQNQLQFEISFTDLSTGDSESLSGILGEEVIDQTVAVSGAFQLSSALGGFQIDFDHIVANPDTGLFVGGALQFTVQSGQLSAISRVALAFDPSNVAFVEVDLANGEMLPFNYDLVSGELTLASN
jgi:hypothetical protein